MIRKARLPDAKDIQRIINVWANKGKMLHRSFNDIYESIRDFALYEMDGKVVGVVSLHVVWENIAEIRSLAVDEGYEGKGIGKALVDWSIQSALDLGVSQVFVLTYVPVFFRKQGFGDIDKHDLPHKIWSECVRCHKFPDCDETAVVKTIA